jgi:N-acetylmuramic acid 6-phosphate etherase
MASKARITERANRASASLDTKSTREILRIINREDHKVAPAVARVIPQIGRAVDLIAESLAQGGRLIYLGAGTSGRLGVLDAAECIPTFGTDQVIGLMAGAPEAMFRPTEASEDNPRLAVRDLRCVKLSRRDVLVGISASGRTPYVLSGMQYARKLGAKTIGLTCNPQAALKRLADVSVIPVVGPEVIAGSSRMKAGTAQKLVLNMVSTASMVRLGRVYSNLMVNVQLANRKLRQRGLSMLRRATGASPAAASRALKDSRGQLPVALVMLAKGIPEAHALRLLASGRNTASVLRSAGLKL